MEKIVLSTSLSWCKNKVNQHVYPSIYDTVMRHYKLCEGQNAWDGCASKYLKERPFTKTWWTKWFTLIDLTQFK